jgi:hypothetical protein
MRKFEFQLEFQFRKYITDYNALNPKGLPLQKVAGNVISKNKKLKFVSEFAAYDPSNQ